MFEMSNNNNINEEDDEQPQQQNKSGSPDSIQLHLPLLHTPWTSPIHHRLSSPRKVCFLIPISLFYLFLVCCFHPMDPNPIPQPHAFDPPPYRKETLTHTLDWLFWIELNFDLYIFIKKSN